MTTKETFVHLFRALDHDSHIWLAFSNYNEDILKDLEFSQEEYENYAKNVQQQWRNLRNLQMTRMEMDLN